MERRAKSIEKDEHLAMPYLGNPYDDPMVTCFYDEFGVFHHECEWCSYEDTGKHCCEAEEYNKRRRALERFQSIPRYADYFRNLNLTRGCENGISWLVYREGRVHSFPQILSHWVCPMRITADNDLDHRQLKKVYEACGTYRLSDAKWEGLHITEGWMLDTTSAAGPALVTGLISVVVGARFLYGDWATAWTMLGSLAGLVAIVLMWINRELSC